MIIEEIENKNVQYDYARYRAVPAFSSFKKYKFRKKEGQNYSHNLFQSYSI